MKDRGEQGYLCIPRHHDCLSHSEYVISGIYFEGKKIIYIISGIYWVLCFVLKLILPARISHPRLLPITEGHLHRLADLNYHAIWLTLKDKETKTVDLATL